MNEITATDIVNGLHAVLDVRALKLNPGKVLAHDLLEQIHRVLDEEERAVCARMEQLQADGRKLIDMGPEDVYLLELAGFVVDLETGAISRPARGTQ